MTKKIASPEKIVTTDEKIKLLEKTLEEKQKAKVTTTYNASFTKSEKLEVFATKEHNKTRSKDLKPADRKPKKEVRPDYGTGK